jgi:hypothetical protein
MSITPQGAGEILRAKLRAMTEEEFVRLATKYSPALLETASEEVPRGPRLLGVLSDEPLSPDALQRILEMIGIRCTEREVEPILRLLQRKEITTAGALTDLAGEGRRVALYDLFLEHRAENARAFDFVACLADASDATTLDAFRARSLTLLSILDEFDRLRSA